MKEFCEVGFDPQVNAGRVGFDDNLGWIRAAWCGFAAFVTLLAIKV